MSKHIKNKWLIGSCLQKSIRKGFTELAEKYVQELYEIDKNYLFYRLSIIAAEDISLSNLELVNSFLKTELKKQIIEDLGGLDYLIKLTTNMCNSVKDRTCSELATISSFSEHQLSDFYNLYKNNQTPLHQRTIAGWEILGSKKIKNPNIKNKEDFIFDFLEINSELGININCLNFIKYCHKIHHEPHFLPSGIIQNLYDLELIQNKPIGKYNPGEHITKKHPIHLVDNQWLIDGIDWHTREGKISIYNFAKIHHLDIIKYLNSLIYGLDNIAKAIGFLYFRIIGQEVNKRLIYETSIAVFKKNQNEAFMNIVGLNGNYELAKNLMQKDIHILYELIEEQFKQNEIGQFPF